MIWDAIMPSPSLLAGTKLSVSSQHKVVRLVVADEVAIESVDGSKVIALVLSRTDTSMTLLMPDMTSRQLTLTTDERLNDFKEGNLFSSQIWMVDYHGT